MRPNLQDRYTDAPRLPANLLTGSVRLLFWLFVHPAAWRSHLARIDPHLPPDFCLAQLHRTTWRQGAFWRFLFMMGLAWPALAAVLLVAVMFWLNLPGTAVFLGLMLGIAVGVITAVAASFAGSLAVSVPIGLAIALVAGLGSALVFNAAGDVVLYGRIYSLDILISALLGLMSGLAGGLAYGVGMGVTREKRETDVSVTLLRQISGVIIGIFIGAAAGQTALLLTANLLSAVAMGLLFGAAVGWRTNSWRRGLVAGLLLSGLALLSGGLALVGFSGGAAQAGGLLVFMTAVFTLPYVLADKVAGTGAGALAGTLGAGAGLFVFLTDGASFGPFLSFGLVGILLGLALGWWRPIFLYPFLLIWNALLYRLDENHLTRPDASPAFRFHSAFWDELQRLHLVNLDAYLLFVMETDIAEGRTAMAYLSGTRQRWAAQEAQIELDARQLEQCRDVVAIAAVAPGLAASDLVGSASALLRSFSRVSRDVAAATQQESAYNQRLALHAVEERLDTLLRELTRSEEPYAERFRPIAAEWRRIVGEQSRALAQEAELRQEIDSPYIIGVPLTEKQEIFTGRNDVSGRIEQLLRDRRQPPLLLYGQRRVGKTSLLNNLGRLLPSTIIPLFVDLQGPASRASDEAGFLYNLARGMRQSAQRQRDLTLPPLSREQLAADPFSCFDEWLDEVELALGDNLALLMLDEFEALEQVLAKDRFDEAIVLGMLRHLIQHRTQFKVLLSGSHTLDEFQRWSSYLINVQVIHIGYLREAEARQLIESPVRDFALRYEPAASQRVLDVTRGHPFLVQLLCAEIVALKNEQPPAQRRLATLADVAMAVPEALAHGSFFFADIGQNQVGEVGTAVLQAIAAQGEGAVVSREWLAGIVGGDGLDAALRALVQRELLETAGDGCRFQIELIRRWFTAQ